MDTYTKIGTSIRYPTKYMSSIGAVLYTRKNSILTTLERSDTSEYMKEWYKSSVSLW